MNRTAIVIVIFNTADLIVKQIECIKRFCKDETYDIIIIDNSTIPEVSEAILYRIQNLNCVYKKTNSTSGDSSYSHGFACNIAYWKFKDEYEWFLFLDHDNFPIKDFSVQQVLGEKIMAGPGQAKPSGKSYFWPGCVMFNNTKITDKEMIDFSPNAEFGLDTGGNLYKVIDHFGKEEMIFMHEGYSENIHYKKAHNNFYAVINDGMFMHFIAGSNWNKAPENDYKVRMSTLMVMLEEELAKQPLPPAVNEESTEN